MKSRWTIRKFGDLERYGLVALLLSFLLALAFLLEEIRRRNDAPVAARYLAAASLAAGRDRRVATARPPTQVARATPVASPRELPRAEFNFYEPPVRLPGSRPPSVPDPDGRYVVVQKGDTLGKIAARELGNSQSWRRILEVNAGVDPRHLAPGQTLRLPAEVITAASSPVHPRSYVVARNDTLEGIALRFYGSRTRWTEIYEANRKQIRAPGKLQVGTEIWIP